jgi:hypothetical protein
LVIRCYRCNNRIIIIILIFLCLSKHGIKTGWSFKNVIGDNACPVGSIISAIDFIDICKLPLASAIVFTIVTLKDVIDGLCNWILVWGHSLLHTILGNAIILLELGF